MRMGEYFVSKGERLIVMVKRAIKARIPFEYLLVDSWFTNTALVEFVRKSRYGFHLLGMARMGRTKYVTEEWGELNAKAIIGKLEKRKEVRYSRKHRCHHASVAVTLGKYKVKLFFCRRGKRESWRILLTTDLGLDFLKAYEIYSMRWSIEVFFSDSKRHLDLAGCSARDFTSQIAHVSLVMVRYNLMAYVKRSMDYETIGGLFKDIFEGVHELTVVEKIWAIILEVVAVVANLLNTDEETLMTQILEDDRRLAALRDYARTA